MKNKISITIDEKTLKEVDGIIDNIIIRNRSQAVEYLVKNSLEEKRTAAILAGGDEERLRISENEFRITAPVKNSTVIEEAVKKLRKDGFKEVFIVARKNILTRCFDLLRDGSKYGAKINYVEEKSSEGSADSLKLLKGKINKTFLAVFNDIIFSKINLEPLWNAHAQGNAMATIMLTTSANPKEKGTVVAEGNKVLDFVQKPEQSENYLVFSPIFVAEPELLEQQGKSLEQDIFPRLAKQGLLQGHISPEKETHIHSMEDARKYR